MDEEAICRKVEALNYRELQKEAEMLNIEAKEKEEDLLNNITKKHVSEISQKKDIEDRGNLLAGNLVQEHLAPGKEESHREESLQPFPQNSPDLFRQDVTHHENLLQIDHVHEHLKPRKIFYSVDEKRKFIADASNRARFLSTYRRHQNFALPDSIMYYITMNPATCKGYKLMIETCKYFFVMKPIIIFRTLLYYDEKCRIIVNKRRRGDKQIDLATFTPKLWITEELRIILDQSDKRDIISSLIPKIYRFDGHKLNLANQVISYNDYIYLSSAVKSIRFDNVDVKDENALVLPLEKVVEIASKAITFWDESEISLTNITSITAAKLFGNSEFSRFEYFCLSEIPQAFNLEDFYGYMKNQRQARSQDLLSGAEEFQEKNKSTKFQLSFDGNISDTYKKRLEAIIDEILAADVWDYNPPRIFVPGLEEKSTMLESLH